LTIRSGRIKRLLGVLFMVSVCGTLRLSAASIYTETFDTTTGGWQDRDVGKMAVTNLLTGGNPDGCMRGMFQELGVPPPPPEVDAMIATGTLASAAFIGDYVESDALMLGFDFKANNVLPSFARLNLYSGINGVFKEFTPLITVTGLWHSVRMSLQSAEIGGWGGDTLLFFSIITNITRVEIELTRSGESQQAYLVDNFFLDRLPEAIDMFESTATGRNILWFQLRNGAPYRVFASPRLVPQAWSTVEAFTATSSIHQTVHSTTNEMLFYRIVVE